ncbi:MAG TPA: ABC transporter ATP-binding protein [Acidimicrobiia bacterium]|jgi:ABC-type sugar transport system ATPase subunit
MAAVTLDGVSVTRGGTRILDAVSLAVDDGELFAILGASGSGKTSLLRVVAGLDTPQNGELWFDGEAMHGVEPADRDLAMVFQNSSLIPFLSARRNVQFPLDIRSIAQDEIDKRVLSEMRALGIEGLTERYPRQLSAGEGQLVQIARAMVRRPRVLLLDEPLAMLDAPVRKRLRGDLKRLQSGYGVTTLFATNDPEDAMAIADRGAVMADGRIAQVGSLQEMYARPATRLVAELLSLAPLTVLRMQVVGDPGTPHLAARGLVLYPRQVDLDPHIGDEVDVLVRSGDVSVDPVGPISGAVVSSQRIGSNLLSRVDAGGWTLLMSSRNAPADPGREVTVRISRFHVFAADTGLSLASTSC